MTFQCQCQRFQPHHHQQLHPWRGCARDVTTAASRGPLHPGVQHSQGTPRDRRVVRQRLVPHR